MTEIWGPNDLWLEGSRWLFLLWSGCSKFSVQDGVTGSTNILAVGYPSPGYSLEMTWDQRLG